MHKPPIWINVILLILFVIALILVLTGCVTAKEQNVMESRVIAYEKRER